MESADNGRNTVLDIPYGPHPEQRLDVYLPHYSAHPPVVLLIHGGGWSVGDKGQYSAVGARLADEGFLVAIANYRLSPAVEHPSHAEDVAGAVAWCRGHAGRYGADVDRLCLMGHSSGAHLAALVALDPTYLAAHALTPAHISCAIGIAGVAYDLDEQYDKPPVSPFFVPVFGSDSSRWVEAAPLRYLGVDAPPFLLVHGLDDTVAPPSTTEVFAAALRQVGVGARLALLPGENHISVMFAAAPLVLEFLQPLRDSPDPYHRLVSSSVS
jgi:acetyl esterase/lipase